MMEILHDPIYVYIYIYIEAYITGFRIKRGKRAVARHSLRPSESPHEYFAKWDDEIPHVASSRAPQAQQAPKQSRFC